MVTYTSKYSELGFYINGDLKRFANGVYSTEDETEIEILEGLLDAQRVAEETPKPKPKAPAKKTSGK